MGTSRNRELERYGGVSAKDQPDRTVILKDMQQSVLEDALPPMIEEAVTLLKQGLEEKEEKEEILPPPPPPPPPKKP